MIAPSERHLEDWLFEDVNRLDNYPAFDGVVYRQVSTSHGIIDLLVVESNSMTVIELKKGEIDDHALQQVLRYIGDLRDTWESTVYMIPSKKYSHITREAKGGLNVFGILIGRSANKHTLAAAWGANVLAYTYDYDGESYSFEPVFPETQHDPLEYSDISDHMMRMAREWVIANNLEYDGSLEPQDSEGDELS